MSGLADEAVPRPWLAPPQIDVLTDVLANVEPGIMLRMGYGPDFVDRAIAAVMSYFRNFANFHLSHLQQFGVCAPSQKQ